ncbi:MAG: hypothetical protein AABY22_14895 [Nanoarchaeota archaeon]
MFNIFKNKSSSSEIEEPLFMELLSTYLQQYEKIDNEDKEIIRNIFNLYLSQEQRKVNKP